MTAVWVVLTGDAHEGGMVESVHATEAGALAALAGLTVGWHDVQLGMQRGDDATTVAYRECWYHWGSVERHQVEP